MDKNIIKNHLNLLSEEKKAKGTAETEKVQAKSKKVNKDAMKDVEKEMKDYDKASKSSEKENEDAVKKYENDNKQDDLHDLGELQNGSLAATKYGNEVGKDFEATQKAAITGTDSTLGNSKDYANVIPADQAGFTGPEFGEDLYKDIKKAEKLRAKAEDKYNRLSTGVSGADFNDAKMNENKKEKMKRLVFNKEFNGVENALKMIPEAYKVDNKEFHMTDGNEKYEIRWEGDLNEGRAIITKASDKNLMTEDMTKMKHLMGYKSEETLGNLKGAARIDEDATFNDVWNKTKSLLSESEEEVKKKSLINEVKIIDDITDDRYKGKLKMIINDLESVRGGLDNTTPSVYIKDNLIHVSGEDGQHFADYYGQTYDGNEDKVCKPLEVIADKYNTYWEWANAGEVIFAPLD